jgi:hypothetical protein
MYKIAYGAIILDCLLTLIGNSLGLTTEANPLLIGVLKDPALIVVFLSVVGIILYTLDYTVNRHPKYIELYRFILPFLIITRVPIIMLHLHWIIVSLIN